MFEFLVSKDMKRKKITMIKGEFDDYCFLFGGDL